MRGRGGCVDTMPASNTDSTEKTMEKSETPVVFRRRLLHGMRSLARLGFELVHVSIFHLDVHASHDQSKVVDNDDDVVVGTI